MTGSYRPVSPPVPPAWEVRDGDVSKQFDTLAEAFHWQLVIFNEHARFTEMWHRPTLTGDWQLHPVEKRT